MCEEPVEVGGVLTAHREQDGHALGTTPIGYPVCVRDGGEGDLKQADKLWGRETHRREVHLCRREITGASTAEMKRR